MRRDRRRRRGAALRIGARRRDRGGGRGAASRQRPLSAGGAAARTACAPGRRRSGDDNRRRRFFEHLRARGVQVIEHAFPDHYAYDAADIRFGDGLPVLMTEKDAVKCRGYTDALHGYLPVSAELEAGCERQLREVLKRRLAIATLCPAGVIVNATRQKCVRTDRTR